jgi:hypothetical protein
LTPRTFDGFDRDPPYSGAGNPVGNATLYGGIQRRSFLACQVPGGECAEESCSGQEMRFADHSNITFIEERRESHSDAVILRWKATETEYEYF